MIEKNRRKDFSGRLELVLNRILMERYQLSPGTNCDTREVLFQLFIYSN